MASVSWFLWVRVRSPAAHDGFKALRKCVEILGALLPDRPNSPGSLFAQCLAATTGAIGYTAVFGKFVEVYLLDMHLRTDIRPTRPSARPPQARENPSLKLLPSVFRKETPSVFVELIFNLVEIASDGVPERRLGRRRG